MQFQLDGFKTGDPARLNNAESLIKTSLQNWPDKVDVLIAGCGLAGLTLADQLAAFPDI